MKKVVCDNKFTEFTIYWLYLLKTNQTDLYTHKGFPLWKHNLTHNVIDYENISPIIIRNSFITPQSHFSVIQSYLRINIII